LVQTFTERLDAAPERVFPLLCPVREYDWLDGWRCSVVHTDSGLVEEGCIFVTDQAPEGKTIWVTTVHDPAARRVEFVRVTPGSHVARMTAQVAPAAGGGASLELGFTFTALGARGAAVLAALEAGALRDRAHHLGRSLDHFLRTGSALKRPAPSGHGWLRLPWAGHHG
jgi:hypothetical protein